LAVLLSGLPVEGVRLDVVHLALVGGDAAAGEGALAVADLDDPA
jgi:hypothetical protein